MDSTIGNQENLNAEVGYPPLRVIGNIVSVLFHPLFIPLYVTAFLLYWHPTYFAGFNGQQKIRIMATIAVNLFLLPAVTVFLLWRLKFSNSIQLKTQKERIIPYAATMFFSFWAWNVFRNLSFSPETYNDFLLGVFITVIIGWMANIWFKISMHALGVGGMLFFVILVALSGEGSSGQYIATATAITGLTLSARLISSDHTGFELYGGLLLGAAAQYIATIV